MKHTLAALATLVSLAWPGLSVGSAQSLAELARQEEARRKGIKTPSRVYTNDDLKRYQPLEPMMSGEAAAPPPAAATTPPPKTPEQVAAEKKAAEAAKGPVKDEAYWRGRITEVRMQIEQTKTYIDAMQVKANSLYADMVARDDPAQKLKLEADRQKTLAELNRLKNVLVGLEKSAADIEEEARRAGVPPGWLR